MKRPVRPSWTTIAVGLVVLGLLAFSVERGMSWREVRSNEADERAASAAAVTQVEQLVGISGSTADEDIERLLDGATGDFHAELESQIKRLQQVLADSKVKATGEAVSTGVVTLTDDKASVIVAASGTVQNKDTDKAEPRNYRLKVDLVKMDGRWLISGLEFVA
ncbi:hypothetical protein [Nocardioides pelophilus]|uniref:hypothetical protein n=1 Tax=Nocardioides pelophilus TaxID=2172019 RepID=UPI0016025C97|nr:hypothetical protein [Nocardioides pelophilus]